jgi:hypothetical protein
MIALSKKMNITNLLLTKIIAYQESNDHEATAPFKDISHAYIIHRFILDIINSALENPENSPIALTYRARQMTASEELTEKSTGLEIPKVGRKFHEGITYADRASTFLTEKSKLYAIMNGIIYRASIGLEYLYNSNIEERKILIKKVDDYNDLFELNRKDIKPVFFGIDKELDPTRYPIDFGIEYRNNLKEITKFIKIRQTLLKDSDGNQYKFDGVFWDGLEPLAVNTSLGFYEGRVVTECDNTISNDKGPIQYNLEIRDFKILVNAEEISESNWTRYINDGEHGQKEKKNLSNIKFFSNGSVITTSIIEPGMEFYTSYGKYYWNSQKKK